jgi:DNA (cytosine-5)-methyltransferase 1
MTAYYNEIDPNAAQWLRNLIAAGHIAPGIVDERSIEDVLPSELAGYIQCHFFAGVGVWSHALRSAGWPDDRPVWTGSCPCQPFSSAGKGAGFDDERHLWPAFQHLIKECRPAVVFGEQVASKAVEPWIDLVHADLEALDYTFGCVPFPSAGVGAPHIRDRAYWVGYADGTGLDGHAGHGGAARRQGPAGPVAASSLSGGLADANGSAGQQGSSDVRGWADGGHAQSRAGFGGCIVSGGLADAESTRSEHGVFLAGNVGQRVQSAAGKSSDDGAAGDRPGPVNGFWTDVDWLGCRDGKWRPVQPGTFPLVNGAPARVVRLRAYGNAINAKAAQAFIEAVMEVA